MLTLTFNDGESVYVDGTKIEIEIKGGRAKLRFDGPGKILREKLYLKEISDNDSGNKPNDTGDAIGTA